MRFVITEATKKNQLFLFWMTLPILTGDITHFFAPEILKVQTKNIFFKTKMLKIMFYHSLK